jgi:hypothetical protein
LIDHHQSPGLRVLYTFHVTKDIRPVPLIKAIFYHATVGSASSLRISGSRL